MIFRVAIGTLEKIVLHFRMQEKVMLWSVLMASVTCLYFSMQEEIFLNILMPSVICVHFSQLVDHCVT